MYIDDGADALVYLLKHYSDESIINIGTGLGTSIRDMAAMLASIIGFEGSFIFDTSRPDGAAQRLLDSSKLASMGWQAQTDLRVGLTQTYEWFLENIVDD